MPFDPHRKLPRLPGGATGLTHRQAMMLAGELYGPLGAVREMDIANGSVRLCEVGHLPNEPDWWAKPMTVTGSGSSWVKAFAAAGVDVFERFGSEPPEKLPPLTD